MPGGHVRLSFADAAELERAARAFDGASRDDEALTLQIPSDGGVGSLRALLDKLDADSIDVAGLSVETPDLDDVFLSLTGDHDAREGGRPMTAYPLVVADSATMLRRNLRRMRRYPSLTFFIAGIPVVFLLLFVFVFGGTLGAGLGGRRPAGDADTSPTSLPGSC